LHEANDLDFSEPSLVQCVADLGSVDAFGGVVLLDDKRVVIAIKDGLLGSWRYRIPFGLTYDGNACVDRSLASLIEVSPPFMSYEQLMQGRVCVSAIDWTGMRVAMPDPIERSV